MFTAVTLYPTLHRLEAAGLLRSRWADAKEDPVGAASRSRKYYAITGKGRAELARRTDEWREFATAVNAIVLGGQP